jgi:hypothetical protein
MLIHQRIEPPKRRFTSSQPVVIQQRHHTSKCRAGTRCSSDRRDRSAHCTDTNIGKHPCVCALQEHKHPNMQSRTDNQKVRANGSHVGESRTGVIVQRRRRQVLCYGEVLRHSCRLVRWPGPKVAEPAGRELGGAFVVRACRGAHGGDVRAGRGKGWDKASWAVTRLGARDTTAACHKLGQLHFGGTCTIHEHNMDVPVS